MPIDPYDFTGRTVVVTGGARGIGRAIAHAFAAVGADVHVFDRDFGEDMAGAFTLHQIDIADGQSVGQSVATLPKPPSVLVNNAGITRDRSLAKMSDDEWGDVLAVNLTGAFNMLRAVAPAMTQAGYGRIINITSINGMRGKFGQANYAASKAGLIGLTKTAARELGGKGVTVNAVAPGMVMTEMAKELPIEILDRALAETVTGRLATPEEVAACVLFLAGETSGSITGQVLQVDSGQYL